MTNILFTEDEPYVVEEQDLLLREKGPQDIEELVHTAHLTKSKKMPQLLKLTI